jgi:VanZ family protein
MLTFVYKYAAVLCACWAGVIFILCATPGQYIPGVHWLDLLSFDKWVHASVFFILMVLGGLAATRKNSRSPLLWLCFLAFVLYGMLLEYMQGACFSNRSADWKDIIANSFGCVVGLLSLRTIRARCFAEQKP